MIYGNRNCAFDTFRRIKKIEFYPKDGAIEQITKHEMRQDAHIRRFEILGDRSAKISNSIKNKYPQIAWNKMKQTRNYLFHKHRGIILQLLFESNTVTLANELENRKQIDLNNI